MSGYRQKKNGSSLMNRWQRPPGDVGAESNAKASGEHPLMDWENRSSWTSPLGPVGCPFHGHHRKGDLYPLMERLRGGLCSWRPQILRSSHLREARKEPEGVAMKTVAQPAEGLMARVRIKESNRRMNPTNEIVKARPFLLITKTIVNWRKRKI